MIIWPEETGVLYLLMEVYLEQNLFIRVEENSELLMIIKMASILAG